MTKKQNKIETLEGQGVEILAPQTLQIDDDVDLSQIRGPNTVLHPGTRLRGGRLQIHPGVCIGTETPATVDNCAVGSHVELAGGYFADAVFLDRAKMGSGAHVRGGTLLEEQANGAHTVGLKQTVLLPFVTLGSLINFCDVMMAGGTSRKDHSEVGSSFIHFNFTPFGRNGDKATASLAGDVPHGVMLRSRRIFLGGQSGLVGPLQIDFGAVLAAGFVYRQDHGADLLVVGEPLQTFSMPFDPLRYSRIRDKVQKNLRYIGNLVALWHWYRQVRLRVAGGDDGLRSLYRRAMEVLESGVAERTRRLGQIAGYMEDSIKQLKPRAEAEARDQRAFADGWPAMQRALGGYQQLEGDEGQLQMLLQGVDRSLHGAGDERYLDTIRGLDDVSVDAGTRWLEGIVASVVDQFH